MVHGHRWLIGTLVVVALAAALALTTPGGQESVAAPGQPPIHVDVDAPGPTHDGSAWDYAFTDLQDALDAAVAPAEIWVAAGTYKPTQESASGDPRSATFQMENGVALYGGFDPSVGATEWEDRDWTVHVTILSGDVGVEGDTADNAYHVFYHPAGTNLDDTAILDGFTITGGNANGDSWPQWDGGGMYNSASSPTLTNCTFAGNLAGHGSGLYNHDASSPELTDVTFSGNQASGHGGGMYNDSSSPRLTNCQFSDNIADTDNSGTGNGGGMYNITNSSPVLTGTHFFNNRANYGGGMGNRYDSSPNLINVTFSDNIATADGGGMHNEENSSPTLTNVTFSRNTATDNGGGMYNWNSSPTLTNCILWGDTPEEIYNGDPGSTPVVTYSDVQGGYGGEGNNNIDADPLFWDAAQGNYHLGSGSPCIDAGDNGAPDLPDYDFEGDPRIMDGGTGTATVDMGVDEYEPPPDVIFVDLEAAGANDGTSWDDAFPGLQAALAWAQEGVEIWVAAGTYTPTQEFSPGDPRSATFQLKNGVALYGGFDPSVGDTGFEDRDWVNHVTILSGDLNGDDVPPFGNNGENSYHVFYHPHTAALGSSAILDGFTIAGGNASGAYSHDYGGGMYNFGSSPTLTNCTFSGNEASQLGGGVFNYSSHPALTNCTFSGNSAGAGGGMMDFASWPTLTNCTFWGNSGGGMYYMETLCISWGNCGGGMDGLEYYRPVLTNSILWNNSPYQIGGDATTVTYSDIQGGYSGEGNINADPLFVDPANGDFHLRPGSPCIDKGDNLAPDLPNYDFEGDDRIMDGDIDGEPRVDMGVDEARIRVYVPRVLKAH